mmetsp:Transcript_28297/g.81525  ORF Transcript_28297/g.81525 Transcript_28297/m.81525 type:complete len:284 (+) Transcript_28297:240-1091(+)
MHTAQTHRQTPSHPSPLSYVRLNVTSIDPHVALARTTSYGQSIWNTTSVRHSFIHSFTHCAHMNECSHSGGLGTLCLSFPSHHPSTAQHRTDSTRKKDTQKDTHTHTHTLVGGAGSEAGRQTHAPIVSSCIDSLPVCRPSAVPSCADLDEKRDRHKHTQTPSSSPSSLIGQPASQPATPPAVQMLAILTIFTAPYTDHQRSQQSHTRARNEGPFHRSTDPSIHPSVYIHGSVSQLKYSHFQAFLVRPGHSSSLACLLCARAYRSTWTRRSTRRSRQTQTAKEV